MVIVLLLSAVRSAAAFETDQFNLSPVPLADIGDEISQYVATKIADAVRNVNADIAKRLTCLQTPVETKGCRSKAEEQKRLEYLRSDEAIVHEVFKQLGDGNIFRTKFGKWVNSHDFQAAPARYKTGYFESIYVAAPANYVTISPTINMYGTEFGTDKLEHFFQQGYSYYTIRHEALSMGAEEAAAVQKAVEWGQKTERTYYGLLVSGVYSNADLYANYTGMRFYEGLTGTVTVGETTRPPIIAQQDGTWQIKEPATVSDDLLRPFISEHLNEALNPSGYAFTIFASVRLMVKKRACDDWHTRYPAMTAEELDQKAADLELWHDEDYGNMPRGRLLRLSEVCFGPVKERAG